MRHAVIKNGLVVNVVELEDPRGWTAPEGCSVVASDYADIGDSYAGSEFSKPPVREVAAVKLSPYEALLNAQPLLKALLTALNDGSFTPGDNLTEEQLLAVLTQSTKQ